MSGYSSLGGFAQILTGKKQVVFDQVDGPQDATVLAVDAANLRVIVTMSASNFSTESRFGPFPYTRCNPTYAPQVGDRCLVIFVGKGIDRGRVVSWWPPD